MISRPVQGVDAVTLSGSTPWVGTTLPSPFSAPVGPPSTAAPTAFTQTLEEARTLVNSGGTGTPTVKSADMTSTMQQDGGMSKKMGFASIESMATRLSDADAKMYRSVESLNNLDPTSPNLQAELLSVSLMSTKAGISTTLAMKFSSKVNESINTLLKTS